MKSIQIINQETDTSITIPQDFMSNLEGWEYPSVRDVVEDISGKQSSVFVTSKFGRRVFSFMAYLRNQDHDERIAMLEVLRQDGYIKLLKFTTLNDLELQAEINIRRVLYPYSSIRKPFLIEMVAPDWRFYSQDEVISNSNDAEQIVENLGNERTDPTFRIYGPGTSFLVTNLNTGEEMEITHTLLAAEYIDIDVFNRTVIEGGDTSIFTAFEGEFLTILPGENTLQWSVTGGGAETSLATTFRHAYNGV